MLRSEENGGVIVVAADEHGRGVDRDAESMPRAWWRSVRHVLQLLAETANPTTTHTEDLTSAELAKQNSFESIDYYKAYPDIYIEYLREHHKQSRAHDSDFASSSTSLSTNANTSGSSQTPMTRSPHVHADHNHTRPTVRNSDATVTHPPTARSLSSRLLRLNDEYSHVALRWLLHVYIAIAVALVASAVSVTAELMAYYRKDTLTSLLTHVTLIPAGWVVGLLWWCGVSCGLIALSAAVVVYVEPTAAGGGIPDVMAYLNGVYMPRAIHLRTFVAKAVSCVCAVAGGLPVGLEAPLIHLGAITGAGVTQGRSRTLGWQTNLFRGFRNNKDRRDFITAGAACGVSAAFGAPIGGLLFVMEEVSSFWDHSSSGQILLATLVCFSVISILTVVLSQSPWMHPVDDILGVLFEVNLKIPLNLISILPSLVLGAMLGVLAAMFTKLSILLIRWRRGWSAGRVRLGGRAVLRRTPPHRPADDTHTTIPSSSSSSSTKVQMQMPVPMPMHKNRRDTALPSSSPHPAHDETNEQAESEGGRVFIWSGGIELDPRTARLLEPILLVFAYTALTYFLTLLAPCTDMVSSSRIDNDTVLIWGTESDAHTSLFNATCHTAHTYSPFGTLHLASGKNSIRHLFSRQTAGAFSVPTLTCFVLIYTCFACLSNGAAVSGGLVVPSLAIGAGFGRLFGLLLWRMAVNPVAGVERGYAESQAWLDPGVFALVGAGAFLAGTTRLTISVSVIMVELSAELNYLLPVMAAIVVARTVADWLCEPLYHHMLRLNCVPYLPPQLPMREFEELTAADMMASRVVTLRTRERSAVIARALRETTHHAFPVMEEWVPPIHRAHDEAMPCQGSLDEPQLHMNMERNSRHAAAAVVNDDGAKRVGYSMHTTSEEEGEESTAGGTERRYKFVGLITREDLLAYFALPPLRTGGAATRGSDRNNDDDGGGRRRHALSERRGDGAHTQQARDGALRGVENMTWTTWYRHKAVLFLGHSPQQRNHIHGSPTSSQRVSMLDEAALMRLPAVVDLSRFVNRSPWVIPAFFNCHMVYQTFRTMGLRHMVVVDGEDVCGIITRKDLLINTLRQRMKELRRRVDAEQCTRPTLPGQRCRGEEKTHGATQGECDSVMHHSRNRTSTHTDGGGGSSSIGNSNSRAKRKEHVVVVGDEMVQEGDALRRDDVAVGAVVDVRSVHVGRPRATTAPAQVLVLTHNEDTSAGPSSGAMHHAVSLPDLLIL